MIKLIATDMDGTFLREDKSYDEVRFEKFLERLNQHDVRFVVASGNQYRLLASKFPQHYQDLTFISENGAHIVSHEEDLVQFFQSHEEIETLISYVEEKFPQVTLSLTGDKAAYVLEDIDPTIEVFLRLHLPLMKKVSSLLPLPDDHIYKTVIVVPDGQTEPVITAIKKDLADLNLVPTASGYGSIDVITRGVHKAWGLEQLMTKWGLTADQVMAFGDNANDMEMLELAGQSYAMANASDQVKAAAKYVAKSNQEDGVLDVIEAYLDELEK
ncbi:Cof-type HAD-IIB family hydrolase [Streptococcus hyovaginalis]|uniref:Cof-type HAD-IIB family hydrolase n=1 Tax=Streptococcus hyovaginalis TaxID=149015 RepID=UPI002A911BA7|nr:Cof-type HAD-IIB family hydrolase [Streptococcus hyovaginalis]MDY5973453.1 Cof-type HAD-IIB family hydrolase [Streptococcus hyovaginalis]